MANFSVRVCKVEKKAQHPNADRLTIYNVGGYNCISNKLPNGEDRYNVGDLVVYIPEQSVLPKWLLQKMELWNDEKDCGLLGGSKGDRVVTIKLRGIPSTGLLYPITNGKMDYMGLVDDDELEPLSIDVDEGDNVMEHLGISKYEPPIPVSMGGEIFSGGTSIVESYDVEPIEKYKHLLVDGEEVIIQEKLHGTQTRWCFTKNKSHPEAFGKDNDIYISSKGQGDKGLFFKNVESNKNAYWVRAFLENGVEEKVKESKLYNDYDELTIYSETIGCQDLKYGLTNGKISNAVFDIYVGKAHMGRYLNYNECQEFCKEVGLEYVPVLYVGPYSYDKVKELTDGKTTYGSNKNQIREGVVVKPLNERWDNEIGRVMVKSVSVDYKLRKNGTEMN